MSLADLIPSLRTTLSSRLAPGLWPETARATCDGQLLVGGVDLAELAGRFGTPVLAVDATDVRSRCRAYREALPGVEIAYAAKAFLCRAMARLVDQEGLAMDVCSGGEVAVAAAAGFPGERMMLHGNVKTDEDLKTALAVGVGRIVLDSLEEIPTLAAVVPTRQQVLLRVVPGVDAGTHAGLTTGTEDQKFGLSITTGAAAEAVRRVLARPELELVGLHCHIGSQVRSVRRYVDAAERMVAFLAEISREHGVELPQLDIGGGHAVAYGPDEQSLDLAAFGRTVPAAVAGACRWHGLQVPRLTVEPGRALVARAGVTVYRVAAVKHGVHRTFVAVDGGMSDNPRPALYGARYPVRRFGRPERVRSVPVTVVGRHCESSDVLAEETLLPEDIAAGDLLAVPCSGAYHASLSSTYNQVGRPPVVAVASGAAVPMLRRETVEDLLHRDAG
ncbi:diaminopimelate decarboxylase [Pseudonocardia xinjiangensis]|uniref:Diaminopimelate decarboxylase n=1 Tax=Pseudonocardia xinjiangensis TaxID=75289 RepID=A0ABX1RI59_9PSEU|nr:diaminopimelate decarboxylase [Pseudonocardia xinjiangensis]NMH80042.1 diaminopimelate decarboxylase [Pseudonocardia xinjiangensis]